MLDLQLYYSGTRFCSVIEMSASLREMIVICCLCLSLGQVGFNDLIYATALFFHDFLVFGCWFSVHSCCLRQPILFMKLSEPPAVLNWCWLGLHTFVSVDGFVMTSSLILFLIVQRSDVEMFFFYQYKLCKVKKLSTAAKGVPYLVTHDARTIRYPHPDIKSHDTCVVDIATGKITKFTKFEIGACFEDVWNKLHLHISD